MQSENKHNLYHILEELNRIHTLILANVSCMFEEQDKQQAENNQSLIQSLGIPLWVMQKATLPELKEKMADLRHKIDVVTESSPNIQENLRLYP